MMIDHAKKEIKISIGENVHPNHWPLSGKTKRNFGLCLKLFGVSGQVSKT